MHCAQVKPYGASNPVFHMKQPCRGGNSLAQRHISGWMRHIIIAVSLRPANSAYARCEACLTSKGNPTSLR